MIAADPVLLDYGVCERPTDCRRRLTAGRQFVDANRYESFAPVRDCACRARWYVDGSDYMRDVADAMEAAREEIFITDWWLSPEIFLKRPALDSHYWRLDQILLRKAVSDVPPPSADSRLHSAHMAYLTLRLFNDVTAAGHTIARSSTICSRVRPFSRKSVCIRDSGVFFLPERCPLPNIQVKFKSSSRLFMCTTRTFFSRNCPLWSKRF